MRNTRVYIIYSHFRRHSWVWVNEAWSEFCSSNINDTNSDEPILFAWFTNNRGMQSKCVHDVKFAARSDLDDQVTSTHSSGGWGIDLPSRCDWAKWSNWSWNPKRQLSKMTVSIRTRRTKFGIKVWREMNEVSRRGFTLVSLNRNLYNWNVL